MTEGELPGDGEADGRIGPLVVVEPPWLLVVDVDGQRIEACVGKPFALPDGREVTVHLGSHRTFRGAGLVFDHPARFVFAEDSWSLTDEQGEPEQPSVACGYWTLEGEEVVLHVMHVEQAGEPEEIRREWLDGLFEVLGVPGGDVTRELQRRQLGGRSLEAEVLSASGELRTWIEAYAFQVVGGVTLLAVQEVREQDGRPSVEWRGVMDLLERTLRVDSQGRSDP